MNERLIKALQEALKHIPADDREGWLPVRELLDEVAPK
jgi:hypothetical protein